MVAFFGDKYGKHVRVINAGGQASAQVTQPSYDGFSQELCGGCHCKRTGDLGLFKLISEGAIASGVRRIEAVAGLAALDLVERNQKSLEQACETLHTNSNDLQTRLTALLDNQKKLEKELEKVKAALASAKAADVLNEATDVDGVHVLTLKLDSASPDELRGMADELKQKFNGIVLLAGPNQDKVGILVLVTPDYVKQGYQAGKLVKEVAKRLGGGGGGRADMAMAGAKDLSKLDEVLAQFADIIRANK